MTFRDRAADFYQMIREIFGLLAFNFRTLVIFVVFYTFNSWIVVSVVTYFLKWLSMKAAGMYYLGNDNFLRYLRSPVTWLTFIVGLFVVGYVQMIQIGGMIHLFQASAQRCKVGVVQVVEYGLESAYKLLNIKRNWSFLLFMILMLPYMGLFSLTNVSFTVAVPGFLREYLFSSRFWSAVYVLSFIAVFIFTVRWMVSLHIFVLENKTFRQSKGKSIRLMQKDYLTPVLYAAAAAGIWMVIYLTARLISMGAAGAFAHTAGAADPGSFQYANTVGELIIALLHMFITPCFCLAFLSALFHRINTDDGNEEEAEEQHLPKILAGKVKYLFIGVLAACIVIYAVMYYTGRSVHNTDPHRPAITAHMGDSIRAPENTRPAFELALNERVSEWIEFDVRQTADHVAVIWHDDRLYKSIGVNRSVHNMTYEELLELDFGSWFGKQYAGTQIMTLSEMMDLCRDGARLMIELKPTSYDQDFAESVVALIREKEMAEQCVVSSMNAPILQRVKELDPEIVTAYIMAAANGRIEEIPYADWFSIEESNITEELVGRIHAKNKLVFTWTVNEESKVQRLIDAGVDGILTDDPLMLEHALANADYSGGFLKTLRSLTETPNFILQFGF